MPRAPRSAACSRPSLGGPPAALRRAARPHPRRRRGTGDGTLARTGGRVVKNVAGHAVHRLLCGSRGGLGVMLEASLKLLPAPAARRALVWPATSARLDEAARWAPLPRLEPAALTVLGREAAAGIPALAAIGDGVVIVGLEDDAVWVESQTALARERLGPESARLEGAEVATLWQSLADLEEGPGARLTFTTASNTPVALAPLADTPEARRAVFHAPAGRLHLFPDLARAQDIVRALAASGFALIGARGADGVVPALPAQVAVATLRRRVRAALDPAGTLVLGDRWGTP